VFDVDLNVLAIFAFFIVTGTIRELHLITIIYDNGNFV
jgi:hypothetical protein